MSNDVNLIVNFRCSLDTLMGLQQLKDKLCRCWLVFKNFTATTNSNKKTSLKASLNSLNYTGRELVRAVQQLL